MSRVVWDLPVPSSGLVRSPRLEVLPRRRCQLSMLSESEGLTGYRRLNLVFRDVEIFKCTYQFACDSREAGLAYDKLVSIDQSELLERAVDGLVQHRRNPSGLEHL